MSSYEIPFDQIVKTLEFQNMSLDSLRAGDIIVIRFGYLSQYENMDAAKREYLDKLYQTQKPDNVGLKPSEELLRFLWNTKIAAICGDARSLEVWPCKDLEWHLHEWLLAGWGMPIGELFYLEELARTCKKLGRYTFFMSSSPMNVGVPQQSCSKLLTLDRCLGLLQAHQMPLHSFERVVSDKKIA